MTRLFTRHDVERAARLAANDARTFPDADPEVLAVTVAARIAQEGEDWLPMHTIRERLIEAFRRGEQAMREQQRLEPEEALRDLLT